MTNEQLSIIVANIWIVGYLLLLDSSKPNKTTRPLAFCLMVIWIILMYNPAWIKL